MELSGIDLKVARVRAGQRQYKVAAALGITQTRLYQIESGKVTARPNELSKLREVLGIISE